MVWTKTQGGLYGGQGRSGVRANRPRRSTIRDQVIAVLAGGELPIDDIRKRLPDVPVASLQVTMARIFKRGEIIRPSRATYGLSSQERN